VRSYRPEPERSFQIDLLRANDAGALLQGYCEKKLSWEYGDVFFCCMPCNSRPQRAP
jgi:hypothetical protein